jgi:antitoxin HicB
VFYPVTLTKDTNGTMLVRFPDVPGAVTSGDTRQEALTRAVDALLTVFDAYMKDKRDIPAPSASTGLGIEVPVLDASKLALYQIMREKRINKTELAKRLDWHMPQVDRVLKMRHDSRLEHVAAAFRAVGKRLRLTVTDDHESIVVPGAIITKARAQRARSASGGRHTVRASKKR